MANQQATSNFGWQNKFSTTLASGITATDTTIPLTALPTPTEGFLVLEPDSSTNWEVIYYTSKTGSAVVCTSVANGRGIDDSTAQSHSSGATVRMDTTAGMFEILQNMTAVTPGSAGGIAFASGWTLIPNTTPSTITYSGNRSYTCVFNGVDLTGTVSAGMRLKTTRTVAAPTQSTSLNGTTQYYSKTSPAGMTFTDSWTQGWKGKLSGYPAVGAILNGRLNAAASNGFILQINPSGQIVINGLGASFRAATSSQSVPLNKKVSIFATMVMATGTATIYLDGVSIPLTVTGAGTSLIQGGDYTVGNFTSATQFLNGTVYEDSVFSAVLSAATIQSYHSQALTGTEPSLISAHTFNGSLNDLNANANNLTASGSATATNADSFYGGQAGGSTSSTLDYGIIVSASFSTNTTLVVQVPEGCTIPTSGGVSAVSYSTQKTPYGFPAQKAKWRITTQNRGNNAVTSNATYGAFISGGHALTVPIGEWEVGHSAGYNNATTTSVYFAISPTSLTGLTAAQATLITDLVVRTLASAASAYVSHAFVSQPQSLITATTYTMQTLGATTGAGFDASVESAQIFADCAYL